MVITTVKKQLRIYNVALRQITCVINEQLELIKVVLDV